VVTLFITFSDGSVVAKRVYTPETETAKPDVLCSNRIYTSKKAIKAKKERIFTTLIPRKNAKSSRRS
jgi:hypothetical protein